MRHFAATAVFVLVTTLALPASTAPEGLATSFEANRGQYSPEVLFSHRSRSFDIQVLVGGAVRISSEGRARVLTLEPGPSVAAEVVGTDALHATASVFVGRRESGWITGIPLVAGVLIREASPGVDLALSADGVRLEIELRGAPGVDPALLRWEGAGVSKAVDQEAVVDLDGVSLRLSPALLPRESRGEAARVGGDNFSAGWTLRTVIEVVAPRSAGSTVEAHDVRLALDADGSVYVAGTVERSRGVEDAFVAKLGPDCSSLTWVAYLGGAGASRLAGIAVTPEGDAVLVGATLALDFPQVRSIGSAAGGLDAFVTRLAGDGASLVFSTRLGGEGSEAAEGVASAPDGTTRVVGSADADAFVAVIDTGRALLLSRTTVDRGGIESGKAITVDRAGLALVAGASKFGDRSWPFVGLLANARAERAGVRMLMRDGDLEGAVSSMALDADGRAWIAGGDHGAWLAVVELDGSVLRLRGFADEAASGTVAVAVGAANAAWLAEQTGAGVLVSRWTTDDADSGRVVARIAALDRPGAVALSADGAVLIAGSTRGEFGVDPDARLIGPIAGNASAVIVVLPGEPKAPLAAGCPGSINFDNSAGTGVWQTAANWDLDVLPGVSDDVCIDGFNVTVPSGTQTVNSVTMTASGSLGISGGTLSLASASQVAGAFSLSTGTLSGSGSLTVSGLITWTGGTMSGAGMTQANGGLAIGGTVGKVLSSSRILNTPGATTWSGTGALNVTAAAVINNTGTWDCQSDAAITGGGAGVAFNNNAPGIFKKSAGAGTTTVGIAFNNTGSVQALAGTMRFTAGYLQTAGSTIVNGGTMTSTTTMNIQGGVLGGVGTFTANVTSAGRVAPGLSPGALSVAGNYVQSGSGTLEAEIGGLAAGTQYDRLTLNATGIGTLSGTLNVVFVNGFVPTGAAVFTVLSGVALNGTFATVNLPALAPPLLWRIVYGTTSVVAEVMDDTDADGTPDPVDCAPLDPGASAIHGEVPGVVFAGDKQTLSWGLPLPSGGADATYDLMRGALNELPVTGGAADACPAPSVAGPSTQDATTPPAGAGFYYLVRARNVCGAGTYGSATSGAVRVSSVCP